MFLRRSKYLVLTLILGLMGLSGSANAASAVFDFIADRSIYFYNPVFYFGQSASPTAPTSFNSFYGAYSTDYGWFVQSSQTAPSTAEWPFLQAGSGNTFTQIVLGSVTSVATGTVTVNAYSSSANSVLATTTVTGALGNTYGVTYTTFYLPQGTTTISFVNPGNGLLRFYIKSITVSGTNLSLPPPLTPNSPVPEMGSSYLMMAGLTVIVGATLLRRRNTKKRLTDNYRQPQSNSIYGPYLTA